MTVVCTTSTFDAELPEQFTVFGNPHGRRLTEEEVIELLRRHRPQGLIAGVEPLTRRAMESDPELRVISRCGVGLDNVDLDSARDLGILVCTTPTAPVESVAELTVGLMLAALRSIPQADAAIRRGEWPRTGGNLLGGKTVGLVGCGRIGSAVASLLAAFGCPLLGYDPMVRDHGRCVMVTLDELLEQSDIISLHAPLTRTTARLIDEAALARMKPGALLVNTARGGLVDEAALVHALERGIIAAAALDVFDAEPYGGPLVGMTDRTVLTSHIGAAAREARAAMEAEAVLNLVAALTR